MSIQGTVLGSGTGIPSLQRNSPGYLLEMDGMRWLVDCGSGTLLQLERLKKSFRDLDGVFVTHTHADHIGDIIPLVHALRFPDIKRDRPFKLFGPAGFVDFFNQSVAPVAKAPEHFPFFVEEMPASMNWGAVTIRAQATIHSERLHSLAYRFELGDKSMVFSGDCDYHQELIDFAKATDVLVIDCSTLDDNRVKGHLTAGLAGLIAEQAGVRRLIPTHFYPIAVADIQRAKECRVHFAGPVDLAEDLMRFRV